MSQGLLNIFLSIQWYIFISHHFLRNYYVLGAQTDHLIETVLLGTHDAFWVCLYDMIFTSHQKSFSYIGTVLPRLNQY